MIFLRKIRKHKSENLKILVIQTAKIGDTVCSTPVFREIKRVYPSAHLDALILSLCKDVLNFKPGLGYPKPGLRYELYTICYQQYYQELIKLPKLVDILCYSLQPNHFHFILKQLIDNGIEKFIHRLPLSYSKYFNHKYKHSGTLFQGPFKSFLIKDENYLARISAYVNCNYEIHKLDKVENWKFSSYKDYLNLRNGNLCNKEIVLNLFKNNSNTYLNTYLNRYKNYCKLVIKDCQDVKKWEKILEE